MTVLSCESAFVPRYHHPWCVQILKLPTRREFLYRHEPIIFRCGAYDFDTPGRKCRIARSYVSVWQNSGVRQRWLLEPTAPADGVSELAEYCDHSIIAALKKVGCFDLAEAILDVQASFQPCFLS